MNKKKTEISLKHYKKSKKKKTFITGFLKKNGEIGRREYCFLPRKKTAPFVKKGIELQGCIILISNGRGWRKDKLAIFCKREKTCPDPRRIHRRVEGNAPS